MFRERKNEQPRSHSSPMNKCKNAKIECGTMYRSQYCRPLAAAGASREGSFVVGTVRQISTSKVGDQEGKL